MTTVQSRDGKDVHEGEDDAEEGCHLPEDVPIPIGREQVADGSETTQRLSALSGKDVFQVVNIRSKHAPTVFHTCRKTLEEAVLTSDGLIQRSQTLNGES